MYNRVTAYPRHRTQRVTIARFIQNGCTGRTCRPAHGARAYPGNAQTRHQGKPRHDSSKAAHTSETSCDENACASHGSLLFSRLVCVSFWMLGGPHPSNDSQKRRGRRSPGARIKKKHDLQPIGRTAIFSGPYFAFAPSGPLRHVAEHENPLQLMDRGPAPWKSKPALWPTWALPCPRRRRRAQADVFCGDKPPTRFRRLERVFGHHEFLWSWASFCLAEACGLVAQLPFLPDLQCAWLLLLFCAVQGAQHLLRTVLPATSRSMHAGITMRCGRRCKTCRAA